MAAYSIDEAAEDLRLVLDAAPPGAVLGEWTATTTQAAHSESSGGYEDRHGRHVEETSFASHGIVRDVVDRLAEAGEEPFNVVHVTWRKGSWPRKQGTVRVTTRFDAASVPRGPDDPAYEAAAAARRGFWESVGPVSDGYVARHETPNAHNQTKWFGPHRRVLTVRTSEGALLATDGLSTPWAGIADPENGVECELVLHLAADASGEVSPEAAAFWGDILLGVGDLVADGYRVLRDVRTHGAILFCRLPDECRPKTRLILSLDGRRIEGLPFGSAALLRATPIEEAEIAGPDLDEPWQSQAARAVLRRRNMA